MANITEVVTDVWNRQLVIKTKICTELTSPFSQRTRVSLPYSLGSLHLQMARTTLEQPTSKWSSGLCLCSPYLEPVWEARTLCRKSFWITPAPGAKKRGQHKETIPPRGFRDISKYYRANLQIILTRKSMRPMQWCIKTLCWLTTRLVTKSHSGAPHIDFSGQEEAEAGWQETFPGISNHWWLVKFLLKKRLLRC